MISQIEKFFADGVKDQLKVMGSKLTYKQMPNGEMFDFNGVITSRDGSLQVELSGGYYSVTGHILIPTSVEFVPKVSDQIKVNNEIWFISSVVRSIIDKAYSCDLVKID